MEPLIQVNGLWKKYSKDLNVSIKHAAKDIINLAVGKDSDTKGLRDTEFWALSDVSFSLKRGQVLAVLGHNGAGKSTLLKCIAGKLRSDKGSVQLNGKLGHLIEMSAGFSPQITGRKNVAIRGQLMGYAGDQLKNYIAEVKDFADIDDFFDSPVQFYSSGMKARLGFAASSAIKPDIMILDEVLAVGDLGFRMKCYSKIDEIRKNTAVILVTHSMNHVARMADTAILLNKGKVAFQGDTQRGIELYQDALSVVSKKKPEISFKDELVSFEIIDKLNNSVLKSNGIITFGTNIQVTGRVYTEQKVNLSIILAQQGGNPVMEWNSSRSNINISPHAKFNAELGSMNLTPGLYYIVLVGFIDGEQIFLSKPCRFKLIGEFMNAIPYQPLAEWTQSNKDI